jgi:hypothetical protein
MAEARREPKLPMALIVNIMEWADAKAVCFFEQAQVWPRVTHYEESHWMCEFVPLEVLNYFPYEWEEYRRIVV